MRYRILALAGLFLCGACEDTDFPSPLPTIFHKSYIWGYHDLEDISVNEKLYFTVDEINRGIIPYDLDKYEKDKESYQISDGIALSMELSSRFITEDSPDEAIRNRYAALRDELGDNSFNKSLIYSIHTPISITGMINDIRITVNEEYAAGYPAGADVSTLFTIFYEHPYAVILNNYQSPPTTYGLEHYLGDIPQAIYKDNLAEVDLSDKRALGARFYFLLNGAPAKTGKYSFTIEVQASDGNALSITTKPIPIVVP